MFTPPTLQVSSYRVRCDMHEGEASTVAPVEVSVVAGVNAPFSGASASVLTRAAAAAASRLTDAIIVLGDDVRRDDDGCYELELPLSKLYAAPNFCTHRSVVDAFVYEADSPVADGPESGASASSAADPDATPAASPIEGAVKVGRELHACRFVLHVAGHDREAREEAHVASLLPSSIHVGAFNELAVAVGSGAEAALPAGFSSLGMPLHVLSTDVRRLPLIAGGVFHAGSGLPPISHVLLISGESAEACLANCPQGYETLPVNLAHDVARILGALPLHVIYEVSHSTSRDDESSAHVAPTAAALDGETAAEGGGAGVVEAEVAAVPAEPVAVDGSESKAVEAAEGALADSDEAATSGANAAAAELPPPADVPETSADHARSSDSVVLAPVELDVFPAFVFVAVLREAHGGQGAGATACQHLVLAAVASLPGVPVHAPPVATPDGYALQLVDLGLRTRARPQDVRGEDDDGTERRLVRLVLAQTSDPHAATRTADAGEGLTVGEYDADTLRELAAAEEAALAASSAEEYAADRDELLEMLRTALAENDSLMQRNFGVQHAISSLFFARLSHEEQAKAVEAASKQAASQLASGGALAHFTTAEQTKKYNLLLDAIAVERAHVAEEDERFGGRALALQQRLDDKDARLGQVAGALADFKLEVAKSSVDGQSGKPMPRDLIAQYERRDAEKAADVGRLQLKNLFLQGQIAKLEAQLAKREQLADGLALIDFEQLKIENSTLVEKIDDRNEELAKLRKKTTTAVQTLTHIREKLHFVTADVTRLQADLLTIERAVSEQRASLGIGKKARERTRAETEKARNTQGFAYNDRCVAPPQSALLSGFPDCPSHVPPSFSPSTGSLSILRGGRTRSSC